MRKITLIAGLLAGLPLVTMPALAADPSPAVKLVIKPLLCVLDKNAESCAVTFDIRWTSTKPSEYCLHDSVSATALHCWPLSLTGTLKHERTFSEEFGLWLASPAGGQRLSEVKIEVLRVGSTDRRRERRTRHVWDVL